MHFFFIVFLESNELVEWIKFMLLDKEMSEFPINMFVV